MIYTLYLSTNSTLNAPTNISNNAQVSWNINFRDFFGADVFEKIKGNTTIKVKGKIVSGSVLTSVLNAGGTTSQNLYVGSVKISLNSAYSGRFYNSQQGSFLGTIQPYTDPVLNTCCYFSLDTLANNTAADIQVPFETGSLTVSMYDRTESTLLTNMPFYQVWLYFDVPDDLQKVGNPLNDNMINRKDFIKDVNTANFVWK